MDKAQKLNVYKRVNEAYSRRTQIAHMIVEAAELIEVATLELDALDGRVALDYGLLGCMASLGIRLEQIELTLLGSMDRTKLGLIRSARLIRMGQRAHTIANF